MYSAIFSGVVVGSSYRNGYGFSNVVNGLIRQSMTMPFSLKWMITTVIGTFFAHGVLTDV